MATHRRGDAYKRSSVADIVNPANGLRGEMQRNGLKPRDHMKENYRNMKAIQRKNLEDKEEAARPQKELYKLPQFKDAQSRVYDEIERSPRCASEGTFLEKGASERRREEQAYAGKMARLEVEKKTREAAYIAAAPPSPRKPSVPREIAPAAQRSNENFIARNKVKAISMRAPEHVERGDEGAHHREYGRVPEYLEERKQQWEDAAAEKRRRAPDPSCPPGMMLMPEEERLSTLDTLQKSRKECIHQLERMPFVIETPSMKKKQDALENKTKEIENAIAIFSKTKVYVAINY